ncbi:MAG: hypothetical protein ABSH53_10425 [Holophaga sp.]|jgi:hypothetical protein
MSLLRTRTIIRTLAWVLGATLAAVLLGYRLYTWRVERTALDRCRDTSARCAEEILGKVRGMEDLAHGLADALDRGALAPAQVQQAVAGALEQAPESVVRISVLFRPRLVGPGEFGPSAERDGPRVRPYRLETVVPYRDQEWFRREPWAAGWNEPFYSQRLKGLFMVYTQPFRLPGASAPSGMVNVHVELANIQTLIRQLDLGHTGYGFLLSAKGVYLADPREELVHERRTIRQVAEETQDPGRLRLADLAARGQGGFTESVSGVTGQRTWVFLAHLRDPAWSLGLVFLKDDLRLTPGWARWVGALGITLALGLVSALVILAGLKPGPGRDGPWRMVGLCSGAILLASAALFGIIDHLPTVNPLSEFKVMDRQNLDRFMERNRIRKVGGEPVQMTFVPTGVALQTLEVAGPGLLRLTGEAWQRFPKGTPPERRGILFPEATTGSAARTMEREEGDKLLQYYHFQVVVRVENDNVNRYPFDLDEVRLRIWPERYLDPVILVPDLETYLLPTPKALPGVDPELSLPGWDVQATDFSFTLQNHNVKFGVKAFPGLKDAPELSYNVTLKRRFLSPAIVAFLPILSVAVLLFALLLAVTRADDKAKATGYNYLNLLRTTIALFFSLVVAQFNIRARVVADGVIWLEWFYFVMYGAVLWVSLDALLVVKDKLAFLVRDDNAVAKFAFWPVLLACFYLITLAYLL